jgi:hypothetical protein
MYGKERDAMRRLLTRVRGRLTFANTTAAIALFVALGGTTYAATLPTNSVGKSQIRKDAVGVSELRNNSIIASEIKANAVGASEVREGSIDHSELTDGGINTVDLAPATRAALTPDRAIVNQEGTAVTGTAASVTHPGPGVYSVTFRRDVSACAYAAGPASVKSGTTTQDPPLGANATVASGGGAVVVVKTFAPNAAGVQTPTDTPFHLIAACAA